jgi:fatty-acyl-CoA synthase
MPQQWRGRQQKKPDSLLVSLKFVCFSVPGPAEDPLKRARETVRESFIMRGLMMDAPLLTTGILRYAAVAHGETQVVSRRIDGGIHRYSYSEAMARCRKLSAALLSLGLNQGDRVGSLLWNTHHHFELFYGATGQGIVLHTINPRLFDDTLVTIINHAEDRWIVVDAATMPLAERLAPRLARVEGYIFAGRDESLPQSSLPNLISYETLLNSQRDDHEWPELDERSASIMCYTSGTTGDPKGIVYSHRSIVLASLYMSMADMVGVYRPGPARSRDAGGAFVPCQRLDDAVHGADERPEVGIARPQF